MTQYFFNVEFCLITMFKNVNVIGFFLVILLPPPIQPMQLHPTHGQHFSLFSICLSQKFKIGTKRLELLFPHFFFFHPYRSTFSTHKNRERWRVGNPLFPFLTCVRIEVGRRKYKKKVKAQEWVVQGRSGWCKALMGGVRSSRFTHWLFLDFVSPWVQSDQRIHWQNVVMTLENDIRVAAKGLWWWPFILLSMLVVTFLLVRGVEPTTSSILPSKPTEPILFLKIVREGN